MPTYRVYLRKRSTTPTIVWDFMETVVDDSPMQAVIRAHATWESDARRARVPQTVPPLSECEYLAKPIYQNAILGLGAATTAQQAFSQELESKVGQFLGTKLDGKFAAVAYPAGFNYGITYGPNAYYNVATLADFDSLLARSSGGQLSLGNGSFSGLYRQILGATVFGFSKADQRLMQSLDTAASAQIASILKAFTDAGGTYSNPLPFGGRLQDVFNQLLAQYGSLENLPSSLSSLHNAIAAYKEVAGPSVQLHNNYYEATARLEAARNAVLKPSQANGGEEIGAGAYYVGYTPDKLPSANELIGQLATDANAVSLHMELSNFSSKSTDLSISGRAGFSIPIMDVATFDFGGSASYDLSTYTSASSEITIDLDYKGVTIVSASPSVLSPDGKRGWYDEQMLSEIVHKSGEDATGYQLQGSEFNVDELFGEGKALARLKTFVISRQPEMSMTFKGSNASKVTSDMKVGARASIDLFGLFRVGSASASYSVSKVDTSSSDGSVTVSFGPPEPSGTIPLEQQVAYVMGGVPHYPPAGA
jgi:hypothetical protein